MQNPKQEEIQELLERSVHRTIRQTDNTEEYQNRGHEILSRVMECMDNENKENTQIFVTCSFCLRLCPHDNVCKNL